MNNRYIKKFNFLIIIIISFTLLFSFNVFAEAYTCPYCYESFTTAGQLASHTQTCSRRPNTNENEHQGTQDNLDRINESISSNDRRETGHVYAGVVKEYREFGASRYTDYELLENNYDFYTWLRAIFSLDNFDSQEVDLFNIKTTMGAITEALLNGINEWSSSPLYKIFVGIGVFLLFISFFVNFFSKSVNNENVTPEQLTRMILELIVATFIIANVKNIANIIVGLFIFTANQAWSLIQEGSGADYEAEVVQITLKLLKDVELDKCDVLHEVLNAVNGVMLKLQFFLPWIASIIGKFGIIFAVIKAEYNIFINIMLYPIAAFDCFDDIKHSNFMKYTKNIASSSLQLTIIVLVIYANNLLLSNYMTDMLSNLNQGNNTFNLAVMSVVFQLVRMTMATSVADGISKQVFGG